MRDGSARRRSHDDAPCCDALHRVCVLLAVRDAGGRARDFGPASGCGAGGVRARAVAVRDWVQHLTSGESDMTLQQFVQAEAFKAAAEIDALALLSESAWDHESELAEVVAEHKLDLLKQIAEIAGLKLVGV